VTSSAKIPSPIILPPSLSHKEKGGGREGTWVDGEISSSSRRSWRRRRRMVRRRNGEKEEGEW